MTTWPKRRRQRHVINMCQASPQNLNPDRHPTPQTLHAMQGELHGGGPRGACCDMCGRSTSGASMHAAADARRRRRVCSWGGLLRCILSRHALPQPQRSGLRGGGWGGGGADGMDADEQVLAVPRSSARGAGGPGCRSARLACPGLLQPVSGAPRHEFCHACDPLPLAPFV